VQSVYDAQNQCLTLSCSQWLKEAQQHQPFLIPIRMGLLSATGEALPLYCTDEAVQSISSTEAILHLTQMHQTFVFEKLAATAEQPPIPVLLRSFSAPVILQYDYSEQDLSLIAQWDEDAFMRWEAIQQLALKALKVNVADFQQGKSFVLNAAYAQAFNGLLQQALSALQAEKNSDASTDLALTALALSLPDLTYIGEQYAQVDIEAIYFSHQAMQQALAEQGKPLLLVVYDHLNQPEVYQYEKNQIARRMLKNICLRYLGSVYTEETESLLWRQYQAQHNMTDVLAALSVLSHTPLQAREKALADFYQKWQSEPLVLDKWFALQAGSHHKHALEHVRDLVQHPDFSYTNPNRVRSVLGVFGRSNLMGFHRSDGKGYQFLADQVLKLDAINPQVAARIVNPFTQWQRYDEGRQQKMRQQLQRMLTHKLSKDLYEVVIKALA